MLIVTATAVGNGYMKNVRVITKRINMEYMTYLGRILMPLLLLLLGVIFIKIILPGT